MRGCRGQPSHQPHVLVHVVKLPIQRGGPRSHVGPTPRTKDLVEGTIYHEHTESLKFVLAAVLDSVKGQLCHVLEFPTYVPIAIF